jgi:cytochrome P450
MNKYTAETPQTLDIEGVTRHFPTQCQVSLNLVSLHTNPKSWGSDVLTWKPARFIEPAGNDENLITPSNGSFQPWVSGPRVCPGKKFAQVEFVATISTIFRKHRVRAEALAGESLEQTKKRVLAVVEDSDVGISPTLKMKSPEKIGLIWEKKL